MNFQRRLLICRSELLELWVCAVQQCMGVKKSAMSACPNTFEYCRGCYVHVDCARMDTHTHTHAHTHTHTHKHTHTHTYTQEQQGWVKAASEVQQVGTVTLQDLHTLQVTDATRSRACPGGMSLIASFFLR